jgi:hypothetical protein
MLDLSSKTLKRCFSKDYQKMKDNTMTTEEYRVSLQRKVKIRIE